MDLMEAAAAQANPDLLGRDAGGEELRPGHHAMLIGRESRDEAICPSSE